MTSTFMFLNSLSVEVLGITAEAGNRTFVKGIDQSEAGGGIGMHHAIFHSANLLRRHWRLTKSPDG
jgi:hypothetical protein